MKISTIIRNNLQVFFFLLLTLATLNMAQEVEDESEFNYIEGSEKGPENWGNIKQEWATCNTGTMQSPINLLPRIVERVPESKEIIRSYQPGPTTLKNRGHDIKLEWKEGGGTIQINGTYYTLQQCHWHSPSEHAINGFRYALEAHLVHQSQDNKIAVIAFLYKYGRPDPFLSSIEEKIKSISDSSGEISGGIIDPSKVRMGGNRYYRYMGSLTTPPCDEGVIWTVETTIGTVSKEQVNLLRDAVDDAARENARPLQPVNGRKVNLYETRHCDDNYITTSFVESIYVNKFGLTQKSKSC